jgi:hypothetical protein
MVDCERGCWWLPIQPMSTEIAVSGCGRDSSGRLKGGENGQRAVRFRTRICTHSIVSSSHLHWAEFLGDVTESGNDVPHEKDGHQPSPSLQDAAAGPLLSN